MSPPSPAEVVRAFWTCLEARDWGAFRGLLADDFVVVWPQSGESFSPDGFVAVNRAYPGDWHLQLRELWIDGDRVVTEVACEIDGRTDTALSLFTVRDGRIQSLREFWPDPMPVPEWRLRLAAASSSPSA